MTDIVKLLRGFAGPNYPVNIGQMGEIKNAR
jgi:hypothetical protein